MVMLLKAVSANKRDQPLFWCGEISDVPQGREPYDSVVRQVERTERVLSKSLWLERNQW